MEFEYWSKKKLKIHPAPARRCQAGKQGFSFGGHRLSSLYRRTSATEHG
ncbi:hypothetical protein [Leisingera sp. ANG59]|nr:hypothetical protein [Leisingera sp. ANG59]NSY36683.1 hypothetical protein [Leisingera sp. ANG59]